MIEFANQRGKSNGFQTYLVSTFVVIVIDSKTSKTIDLYMEENITGVYNQSFLLSGEATESGTCVIVWHSLR